MAGIGTIPLNNTYQSWQYVSSKAGSVHAAPESRGGEGGFAKASLSGWALHAHPLQLFALLSFNR